MFVCGVVAELFADVKDTSAMAYSVSDSDGVCFVPSFSGLQVQFVSVIMCQLMCLLYIQLTLVIRVRKMTMAR